ncbi:MAG: exo-alpha-sialidase [Opitutus sp.]|nr:exo-alpha-sialidase [Opitutus sp.]
MKFPGVPGVVVNHAPVSSQLFVPTSSLAILADGTYLVAHDYAHFDHTTESSPNVVKVFASTDRGHSWQQRSQLQGRWDSLFVHRGALYLFGPLRMHGPAVIRRSTDGGKTWTEPSDAKSGLLDSSQPYHSSGVPVVVHRGRVWRAFEQSIGGEKNRVGWRVAVFSASADTDLLNASNWTISVPFHHGGGFKQWIEGNIVVAPDGEVVNVIRTNGDHADKAMIVHISADGKKLSCDPARDLIDFPGGASKFTIRFDEKSGRYWSLANKQTNPTAKRNVLVLTASTDLRRWTVVQTVLSDPDQEKIGFHYVDWLVDGNDLIFTSRTAYPDGMGGPRNHHDNNFITFHRIEDFRRLR